MADSDVCVCEQPRYRWGVRPSLRELLSYLGPGLIISVACMDPGSWTIDISDDTKFGPTLLQVIVLTGVMAMGIQVLVVKLDITTGKGMAQLCRERLSRPVVVLLQATAELAMVATDMAETIGTTIRFSLVLFLPLWAGSVLVAASSFALFDVRTAHRRGFRWIRLAIVSLVGVTALTFILEMALARPTASIVASGLVPTIPNASVLYVAIGILGAAVMSHSVYFHPYIVQSRRDRLIKSDGDTETVRRRHFRLGRLDTVVALFDAMFMNAAMLIVTVAALQGTGVEMLEEAYVILSGVFGASTSLAFGVALIAAGPSSSLMVITAGQTIMNGSLDLDINVWLRRSVTFVPNLLIVAAGFDPTSALVASQVALSFELPFVLIPLLWFIHEASLMGNFRNRATTADVLGATTAVIMALNDWLLYSALFG